MSNETYLQTGPGDAPEPVDLDRMGGRELALFFFEQIRLVERHLRGALRAVEAMSRRSPYNKQSQRKQQRRRGD